MQVARAAHPEEPPAGCYWPERPEGAVCDPTIALPYEPPELPAALEDIKSKRYAVTARADWKAPTAFVMVKLQLRWIRYYYLSLFNAQRDGKPLSVRTLDSEGSSCLLCPHHPNLSTSLQTWLLHSPQHCVLLVQTQSSGCWSWSASAANTLQVSSGRL